jgi:hypothetical protein
MSLDITVRIAGFGYPGIITASPVMQALCGLNGYLSETVEILKHKILPSCFLDILYQCSSDVFSSNRVFGLINFTC